MNGAVAANGAATVLTDAGGRKITLRKLSVLDQARMLRAVGPRQAENQPYFHLVECACMVADIDGVPLLLPGSEQQIDGLLGRLGDEGIAAVMIHRVAEVRAAMTAAEDAALNSEAKDRRPLPVSVS
jgi:hypothetical protein